MADTTPAVGRTSAVGPEMAPGDLGETRIGPATFRWGERTFVMGILNVTPDSFSGDGLLAHAGVGEGTADQGAGGVAGGAPTDAAVARAIRMASEGADILDVGGESTRPGAAPVDEAEELRRTVPAVRAIRAALPGMPLSVDTTKPAVAAAAIDAGADMINDVWGVGPSDALARLAAERGVTLALMHNRVEPSYADVVADVIADLRRALERALGAGVSWDRLIVDPGIGFGKTMDHNLALLHHLAALRVLRRPILLGTSRKSTIGRVLDLPVEQRLEGTLATTALGIAAGVDMVRVHDVEPNRRVARMSDAIVRR